MANENYFCDGAAMWNAIPKIIIIIIFVVIIIIIIIIIIMLLQAIVRTSFTKCFFYFLFYFETSISDNSRLIPCRADFCNLYVR